MRNFDTELDVQNVSRIRSTETVVEVVESVTVTRQPSMTSTAYLTRTDWAWDDLRDYVVGQIEQRFGPFPRDSRKESGIFKSFIDRHGAAEAKRIAKFAFEVSEGRWKGSPISVNRFCRGSDPYFAEVISARLAEAPIQGW